MTLRQPATLLSLGLSVPKLSLPQSEIADRLSRAWDLRGTAASRWQRIVQGSGVAVRQGVREPEAVVTATTAQRMRWYAQHAPGLAVQAAERAIHDSGIACDAITDLIVVSCTGFSAPGIDVDLVKGLGLRRETRRTMIGFMGCHGAINGLRAAMGAVALDDDAVAMVVCVELCSLHLPAAPEEAQMVAAALFSDGAAACIVAPASHVEGRPSIGTLDVGFTSLHPDAADGMTWTIGDHGFCMTLSRDLPARLRRIVPPVAARLGDPDRAGMHAVLVHPGGPRIVDAVADSLPCDASCISDSRNVLARHGNMSSPTVLFALGEALRRGAVGPHHLMSFGPGLTLESMPINFRGIPSAGESSMAADSRYTEKFSSAPSRPPAPAADGSPMVCGMNGPPCHA